MAHHHLPGTEAINDLHRLYPDLFVVEITLHRVSNDAYALWGLAATSSPHAKSLRTIGGLARWNPEGWAYDLSTSPVDAIPGRELLARRDRYFTSLDQQADDDRCPWIDPDTTRRCQLIDGHDGGHQYDTETPPGDTIDAGPDPEEGP